MRAPAADPEAPLGKDEITALLTFPLDLAGSARRQVRDVAEHSARVEAYVSLAREPVCKADQERGHRAWRAVRTILR